MPETNNVVDPLSGDENLQFGTRIDYDSVDDPRKWDLVHDPNNRPKKKAVRIRRILTPPRYMETVWVPVVKKDENGEEYAGYLKMRKEFRRKNTLLDAMRQAESASKTKANAKTDQLQFDTESTWCYLVFCREDAVPKVRLAFYRPSIMKLLRTKQHDEHPMKKGFLLNGPAICSDIIITKWFDPSVHGLKQTSYAVEYMPDNKFAGRVPVSFWETGFVFKEGSNFVTAGIFTEAEMQAIADFQSENDIGKLNEYLDAIVTPHTDEDVMRSLKEHPLNPWATNKNGAVFPDPKTFMQELARLSVPCLSAPKDFQKQEAPPEESKMPMPEADEPLSQEQPMPQAANTPTVPTPEVNDPAPAKDAKKAANPFDAPPAAAPAAVEDAGGAW